MLEFGLIVIGAYTLVAAMLSAYQWNRDRTGNSGRYGHWWDGKEHD